jgi:hypothetical protein
MLYTGAESPDYTLHPTWRQHPQTESAEVPIVTECVQSDNGRHKLQQKNNKPRGP